MHKNRRLRENPRKPRTKLQLKSALLRAEILMLKAKCLLDLDRQHWENDFNSHNIAEAYKVLTDALK